MSDHEHAANPELAETAAHEEAWQRELKELPRRNSELAAKHRELAAEIERRRADRMTIVTSCMDERTTFVEEALGLLPGEAEVMATGGGKISFEDLEKTCGDQMAAAEKDGRSIVIDLAPHECAEDDHAGCAAFGNDTAEQQRFFRELKKKITAKHPSALVNVLFLDTSKYALRPVDLDPRDARLAEAVNAGGHPELATEELGHAGYGIYVGDTYRAWVSDHNKYFRLSAANPDISGNLGIALKVMTGHSKVDLETTPVVLHIDYPEYGDAERTKTSRENIDRSLEAALADPAAKDLAGRGVLRVVKSVTNADTWEGKLL